MVWEEQLGETSKGDLCWERKKCRAKSFGGSLWKWRFIVRVMRDDQSLEGRRVGLESRTRRGKK